MSKKIICDRCEQKYDLKYKGFCPKCGKFPSVKNINENLNYLEIMEKDAELDSFKSTFASRPMSNLKAGLILFISFLFVLGFPLLPIFFSGSKAIIEYSCTECKSVLNNQKDFNF